jgi:cardiolipin synthase A/B
MGALRADLDHCERMLRVQFSTFEGDAAGQAFARMLLERVDAGVKVQLMLDGYSEVIADDVYPFALRGRQKLQAEKRRTSDLLAQLEASGVAITRVAPAGRFARYLLYRNHKKMVVLDDQVAYVGGLNVSDHNYGWHDFMVRVDGEVVGDIVRDFTTTWSGETVALTARRDDGDYVLNQSAGRPTILDDALWLIAGVRERLVIESPYLCGDSIEGAILAAARRGVRVLLVTPLRPNHLHNKVWVRKLRRRLRHANIELVGYPGAGGMTHAKLLIVDDEVASFGSVNYQEIESLTQKELNVVTRDPGLVAELGAVAAADAAASVAVPVPGTAFGWWTYRLAYWLVRRWTKRLLRKPEWRTRYC